MKRLLIQFSKNSAITLVMLTVVFGTFQPLVAMAQSASPSAQTGILPASQGFSSSGSGNSSLVNSGGTADVSGVAQTFQNPTATSLAPNQQAATSASTNTNNNDIGCSFTSSSGFALCLSSVIYIFTVGIASSFAYVSAYFFDFAIQLSLNSAAYSLAFISQGWTTARDIANMAFLFILIYIAFLIMFSAETSGTIPLLTWVIVIALLVNFSFFFTRLVIDAGNILSIQFYNAITAPSIGSGGQGAGAAVTTTVTNYLTPGAANTKDLTASIMGMLNLQGLYGNTSFQQFIGNQSGISGFGVVFIATAFIYIAGAIMLWILTVMFATAGVKFLFRIVVLWFLIIASPLAFVARAVPSLKKYYDEWQEKLITHAFYPVAFMFIFLILTDFSNQLSGTGGNSLLGGLFGSIPSTASNTPPIAALGILVANVAIRLGFVIAVLWVGLEASNKIGVMGAKQAENFGSWAGGALKGTTRAAINYGPGWAGGARYRNTVATGADKLGKAVAGSRWANETGTLGGIVGYRLKKNVLEPLKDTSLGTVASTFNERDKFLKTRKADMSNNLRDTENREIVTKAAAAPAAVSDKDKDRIKTLSKRELESMKADDLKAIASLLTDDQIKKIKEIEKFSDKEKENIDREWQEASKQAPVQKANKLLTELTRLSPANPAVVAAATAGTTINQHVTETLMTNLEAVLDQTKADHKLAEEQLHTIVNTPGAAPAAIAASTAALGAAITRLGNADKAYNKAKELDTERKKVTAGVGGVAAAETFIRR